MEELFKTFIQRKPMDMITSICMLKICGISISIPLKKFFDRALLTGVFPFEWKKDNSAPIHGNSNKQNNKNYFFTSDL